MNYMPKLNFMNETEKESPVSNVENHGRIKTKIQTKTRENYKFVMIKCLNGKQQIVCRK